ncbi:SH3 domain-containing kinase-binding protein 1 isoform X3 [Mastacembelus armatus]|uniref:SH3 domain-containing kinase-binding protein 1 isoform X3 n=1 Tax=Mastacembelus armatus TaxID=205130 RepID=UPI000E45BD7E|nr:SH3 domain-containing kinase-binding protein 1-like isoform X3 [Mastacembelus armatus]
MESSYHRCCCISMLTLTKQDTEEFVSIVSMAEKLNEQVARAADESLQAELQTLVTLMEQERKENQSEELDSLALQGNSEEPNQNGSAQPEVAPKSVPTQSFSSLLPKALSAVLHPSLPPGLGSSTHTNASQVKHTSPNLEQLQMELRDLRDQFEQMKSQHNKEIKLLMNELDEEKRIRLTLQMEIQRMKKHMAK